MIPYTNTAPRKGRQQQIRFGGYNHTRAASEGEIYDMKNISLQEFPVLQAREPRGVMATPHTNIQDIFVDGGRLYTVADDCLWDNDDRVGQIHDVTHIVEMNNWVYLFPEGKRYMKGTSIEMEDIRAFWSGRTTVQDGTYTGIPAKLNTIYSEGAHFTELFRPGDAVTIEFGAAEDRTLIVREVENEYLRFYEYTFKGFEDWEDRQMAIYRPMPSLKFVIQCNNRLWGCAGDRIFASKQGDGTNWEVFDGVETDSWQVDTGTGGEFTGAVEYKGYPIFFKEDRIFKVYGNRPSNFELIKSATIGVKNGSDRSIAVANETMYYQSRVGIMAYTGGIPQNISAAFGDQVFKNGVGGSDGERYYISMESDEGWSFWCFDPSLGMWAKEDDLHCTRIVLHDSLLALAGNLYSVGRHTEGMPEALVQSSIEFGDFYEGSPDKKGVNRIQFRVEMEPGATLMAFVQYDSREWKQIWTGDASQKRSYEVPFRVQRCDHYRTKFVGTGMWRLYSLTRNYYYGSEK